VIESLTPPFAGNAGGVFVSPHLFSEVKYGFLE
jgi:hypothetical protein